jgi:hypothetical protein
MEAVIRVEVNAGTVRPASDVGDGKTTSPSPDSENSRVRGGEHQNNLFLSPQVVRPLFTPDFSLPDRPKRPKIKISLGQPLSK